MTRVQESPESTVSGMESIIQEYRERISQALELDSKNLKEKAERDSDQIIARAKEEAEEAIAEAKQEARSESERIITRAKEQAEQIVRQSREEARQESARIANEAREKASQIIAEVIERGIKKAEGEFARTASEARSKTSLLLTQVSKSVEQIIDDTETDIKLELESLAKVIAEAETEMQPLKETHTKEAEVNSRRVTGQAVPPPVSISEETEPDTPSVGGKRSASSKDPEDTRLFEGRLKLEMVPPFNQERLEGVPEWLARLNGLKVRSTGGRAGVNRWITTHTIDLEEPMPLLKILKAIPAVKDVEEQKGNIVINLR